MTIPAITVLGKNIVKYYLRHIYIFYYTLLWGFNIYILRLSFNVRLDRKQKIAFFLIDNPKNKMKMLKS